MSGLLVLGTSTPAYGRHRCCAGLVIVEVQPTAAWWLLGANGAGKTTGRCARVGNIGGQRHAAGSGSPDKCTRPDVRPRTSCGIGIGQVPRAAGATVHGLSGRREPPARRAAPARGCRDPAADIAGSCGLTSRLCAPGWNAGRDAVAAASSRCSRLCAHAVSRPRLPADRRAVVRARDGLRQEIFRILRVIKQGGADEHPAGQKNARLASICRPGFLLETESGRQRARPNDRSRRDRPAAYLET